MVSPACFRLGRGTRSSAFKHKLQPAAGRLLPSGGFVFHRRVAFRRLENHEASLVHQSNWRSAAIDLKYHAGSRFDLARGIAAMIISGSRLDRKWASEP